MRELLKEKFLIDLMRLTIKELITKENLMKKEENKVSQKK